MGSEWDRLSGQPGYNERGRITKRDVRKGTLSAYTGAGGKGVNSYQAGRPMQEWHEAWAREALRVLRPGGHLVAFGGTRTFHRLTCAIEDAGFEIRDCLTWMYGSGFPKSLNVSLAIDKAQGAPDRGRAIPVASTHFPSGRYVDEKLTPNPVEDYHGETDEGRRWDGWGTALKPAWEPIVLGRKPLDGTVAASVLTHGTGALHIDAGRIGVTDEAYARNCSGDRGFDGTRSIEDRGATDLRPGGGSAATGRWPANVVLSHAEDCVLLGERRTKAITGTAAGRMAPDYKSSVYGGYTGNDAEFGKPTGYGDEDGMETTELWACVPGCPVRMLDDQAGATGSGWKVNYAERYAQEGRQYEGGVFGGGGYQASAYSDSGGASRFFYCAKAARAEREAGLDGPSSATPRTTGAGLGALPRCPEHDATLPSGSNKYKCGCSLAPRKAQEQQVRVRNVHPTVKPIELMRWLVRLVTPPDGVILDPFTGSGTTGCAAALEGFDFVGIEREANFAAIARARIAFWAEQPSDAILKDVLAAAAQRKKVADSGQLSLA